MKKIGYFIGSSVLLVLPALVSAQGGGTAGSGFDPANNVMKTYLTNILTFVNGTVIPFIIGIGFLVFVWGMFQYFIAGGANDEKKEAGKSLMIYSILGFVLIIVFWGIINLVSTFFGLSGEVIDPTIVPKTNLIP
ncbi:hypothetical protein H6784_05270 [Candidatus Nomurabacteria bacterium]|nr:hypothetical protein [Candidatus Kaiserbacteria bacterium]MCB9814790.1 hypothetical protein [Candidatus Nomurabacteria bacterium]